MAEYVERDKAIEACFDGYADCRDDCAENIRKLRAADVVEVRHGKWTRKFSRPGVYADLFWHCSACGGRTADGWANKYPYCPNCGARMDGEEEA